MTASNFQVVLDVTTGAPTAFVVNEIGNYTGWNPCCWSHARGDRRRRQLDIRQELLTADTTFLDWSDRGVVLSTGGGEGIEPWPQQDCCACQLSYTPWETLSVMTTGETARR